MPRRRPPRPLRAPAALFLLLSWLPVAGLAGEPVEPVEPIEPIEVGERPSSEDSMRDATPAASSAAGLQITIEEGENETLVRLRDPDGELELPRVATSRRGFMLSFDGERIDKQHHRTNAWRLGEVIGAQYDDRAVLRLVQRKGRPGPIDDHVRVVEVEGGLDLTVVDRVKPPPVPVAPSGGLTDRDTDTDAPSVDDTVAALQAALEPATELASDGASPSRTPDTAGAPTDPLDPTRATASPAEGVGATPDLDPDPDPEAAAAAGFAFDPREGGAEGDAEVGAAGPSAGLATWTLVPSILALLGLGLWMRRRKQVSGASALEVVSKTALGPRQQIVQVKVDGRALLLGVTEHQIGLITELVGSEGAPRPAPGERPEARTLHHEFGAPFPRPAPAADTPAPVSQGRIEAFKAKLAGALRQEVSSNAVPPPDPARPSPAGMDELRALLGRHETPRDPAWTREEVA